MPTLGEVTTDKRTGCVLRLQIEADAVATRFGDYIIRAVARFLDANSGNR